jgi:hypothetical protein
MSRRIATPAAVLVLALLMQACSNVLQVPLAGADPSSPATRVRGVTYRPVTGGYFASRPLEPLPWREQNERVAPVPKP